MNSKEQQTAAKRFVQDWTGKGYEKGDSQKFWLQLLSEVYGVEHPAQFIEFENQVLLKNMSFIDGYIPSTSVMIEQKSLGKDLGKAIKQSDGSLLTPFQQAKRYIAELPKSLHPRWVVTCNFSEFYVYDMEQPNGEPQKILLENLEKEYYRLNFLVDTGSTRIAKEMKVSLQAGELVGKLYDAILKQYKEQDKETLRNLNIICVRLVFCLYAEDSGIFGKHGIFHDYLAEYDARHLRGALIELFKVLDTPVEERDPYLDPVLAAFPYVNGGLFADENVVMPQFTDEVRTLLLENASSDFDWSEISPTIFGALFESTLNPETRRSGGMHYTSIENIHKVIDPLFLDSLREELEEIKAITVVKTKDTKLKAFQEKLAGLTFLDPACGSGNFLTETYISLRRLENEILKIYYGDKMTLGFDDPIKVSIGQFYGIEINDFAVTVAKTALWIAESQMMKETEDIMHTNLDFLPLKSYANIVEGNALRIDWEDVVPKAELDYIMGNPPFVGHQWRTKEQAADLEFVCHDIPKCGKLDYVCGWYVKAVDYMKTTNIHVAFVSTNSISQGESVGVLWKPLFEKGVEIEFAHRTFIWTNEAKNQAAVHCVIIGFTCGIPKKNKLLFESGRSRSVSHINGYLLEAPDIFIQSRGKVLTKGLPEMSKGSQPTDGGNLLLSANEKEQLIEKCPMSQNWIRRFMMGEDFINNKYRYCLWLVGVNPVQLRKCSDIVARLEKVSEARSKSPTESVRRDAATPTLFTQIRQPKSKYLAIPRVSSERRKYVPMAFLEPEIIAGDKLQFIETLDLFYFGCLTSNVHNAWIRAVAGRLKSDYSYSPAVYNNFPWPSPTDAQKALIEQTAQAILDARALYPDSSLADLYDELTMPPELRKAHQNNDKAVMAAYGFVKGTEAYSSESACVAELMKMYQKLVDEQK